MSLLDRLYMVKSGSVHLALIVSIDRETRGKLEQYCFQHGILIQSLAQTLFSAACFQFSVLYISD